MTGICFFHSVLAADGTAPDWIHLVPAGRFSGVDGRGPYSVPDAQALINASLPDGERLPIDENHSTDLAAPQGGPSPARGWITRMEARNDGIYGQVEWTEDGRKLVEGRGYRGISPVFTTDKSGRVTRILRAALTNNPNLDQLAKLNRQEPTMDLMTLRAALGLGAEADETAILAAAERVRVERTALQPQLAELQATAVKPAAVIELQAQLATLQAEVARGKAVAFVDGAIKAGKPIAALREHFIARHMANPDDVEKELGALISINAGGLHGLGGGAPARHDMADGDGLTETEASVCKAMGIDPKKFKEHSKKMAAERAAAGIV